MPPVKYEWNREAHKWAARYIAQHFPMFSYGSNVNPAQIMSRAPGSTFISIARINHAMLWFAGDSSKRGGVATLRPSGDNNAFAMGILSRVTATDVEAMDRFEANGRSYNRVLVAVIPPNGKPVRAFTYLRNSDFINAPRQDYVDRIAQGFQFFGFNLDLLDAAVKRSPKQAVPVPPPAAVNGRHAALIASQPLGPPMVDPKPMAQIRSLVTGRMITPRPSSRPTYAQAFGRTGEPIPQWWLDSNAPMLTDDEIRDIVDGEPEAD